MKQFLLKILALLCVMLLGGGDAWGETKDIYFGTNAHNLVDGTYVNQSTGISFSVAKGVGDKAPAAALVYNTLYGGNTLTITIPDAITVSQLKFYASSISNPATDLICDDGSLLVDDSKTGSTTWAGSATNKTLVFSNGTSSSTKACQLTYISITYSSNETRTPVNITDFSIAQGFMIIAKGETLSTIISNDQSEWAAAYTYQSSDEDVATVGTDGTITGVSKGTATITATLNVNDNDEKYKAGSVTSKSIDITVTNPAHKVYFSENGTILNEGGTEYEEDAAIIFPTDICDIADKTFVGWYGDTYSNATVAPSFVTSATMGTSDVTYYAVYAIKSGYETTILSEEFDNNTLSDATNAFNSEKFYNFSGEVACAYTSKYGGVKLGKENGLGYITSKSLDLSQPFTVSIDVKGYSSVEGTLDVTVGSTTKSYTYTAISSDNYETASFSFDAATSVSSIKISTSAGRAYIDNVKVRTNDISYSDYCTTVKTGTFTEKELEMKACAGGTTYYATFSSGSDVFVPCENGDKNYTAAVYTAHISDGVCTLEGEDKVDYAINGTKYSGYFVPANNGIIIRTDFNGKADTKIPYYEVSGMTVSDLTGKSVNQLHPASEVLSGDYRFYKLAYLDWDGTTGTNLGFCYGATGGGAFTIKKGTAYLAEPVTSTVNIKAYGFDGSIQEDANQ